MTPVMEVLDGRPTPAPTGNETLSPDPHTPHLDIRGTSPSCESVSPLKCTSPPPPKTTISSPEVCSPPPSISPKNDDTEPIKKESDLCSSDSREESQETSQLPESTPSEGRFTPYENTSNTPTNSNEEEKMAAVVDEREDEMEQETMDSREESGDPINDPYPDESPMDTSRDEYPGNLPQSLQECPPPPSYPIHSSELGPNNMDDEEDRLEEDERRRYEEEERHRQPLDPDLEDRRLHHHPDSISSAEEMQQRTIRDEDNVPHHHSHSDPRMDEHQHHLPQHFSNQCHMQDYPYPMLKQPHHLSIGSHLHDHLREQSSHLHDYDDPHQSHGGDPRHIHEPLGGEHPQHQPPPPDRPNDGYWNMHLGMLSKVKSEAKEWYDNNDGSVGMGPSDVLQNSSAVLKNSEHDLYNTYRMASHHNMGSESPLGAMNGPRPSSIPHGGLQFSQSPDQRQHQHYQAYQNHPAIREMGPMSPNYQGHSRGHMQGSQIHGASQHPGPQHPGLQHPSQHPHMQQQYTGQQYGGQQQMSMQAHHGQQLPSPYAQNILGPGMGGHVHEGREGREGDPYSFVDEYSGPPPRPVDEILGHAQPKRRGRKPKHIKLMENGGDPLAIAAAQAAHEAKKRKWRQMGPDGKPIPLPLKPRKRIDRFEGIPEDELSKKILPDHLGPNLDIVIISKFPFQIGINPGLFAAYKGHHYAGPGNHFWKCLFLSGLIPEPLTSDDDHHLLAHGIGFTNIVSRTTRGSAELTRKEIKEGGQILLSKLQRYQPRVAVFNGKGIYEIFSGKKEFTFGRQPEKIEGTQTHVWVMPSSSARCAQLPRALDKVPFYTALRKFRDFLKGTITELTEEEITFSCPRKQYKDCDNLESCFEDDLSDSFLDDSLKDERFDPETDTEEISRSISQSLYNLSGMTREQLEALDCPTIPIRKKRGRPKKTPEDPNIPPRPKPRTFPTELMLCNGEEPPRKKRGRPKKVLEDGSIPPPKRAGRKPKALKEMLATQGSLGASGLHSGPHSQLPIGHINGMLSPSGYNANPSGPPFSPQYGSSQGHGHSINGPSPHLGDRMPSLHSMNSPGIANHPGLSGSLTNLHSGTNLPGVLSGNSSLHGCPTPNSNGGPQTPVHMAMPPRGNTPQGYGHSPGYSPSPVSNPAHQMTYNQSEKNELPLAEEERQLGLSPIPASPVMVQPDFEPPTSLPESESMMGPSDPSRSSISSHQDEQQMSGMDRQQLTPSIQSQFSNPSTPADENSTPYHNYPAYPPNTTCSPSYSNNVAPSPSYPPPVSHSPSYPPSVSCSPSYATNNTRSPSFNSNATHSPSYQSPSYPQATTSNPSPSYPRNATQSPSFPTNIARSPSYPPHSNQSPSFPAVTQSPSYSTTTQSPSYHSNINHSPSYPSITRSPSYPASLTHSPSFPPNPTQSPSYRPATSHSPSYSSAQTHSPSLNKPLIPGVNSPQMTKSDVASKSLSGLESLVDQIPSLNESESGPHSSLQNGGPCSSPSTPGPPPTADPFSPGHISQNSSFQSFPGSGSSNFPSHYGSPTPANPYSPQYTSTSTNLSTNFSVSSLANSSLTTSLSYEGGNGSSGTTTTSSSNTPVSSATSSSFSVSSLTGGSPTPTSIYNNSYSPAPGPSPHSYSDIMGSSILPPTPPMGHSFMGSPSLMGSAASMSSSMGGSAMGALHSSMNMSGSQLPYPYNQYADAAPGGYNGAGHSFPYSPSGAPGFHVPSPRFPYPSPYSSGPYSQGYSQNSVLERIKQTGMGMGFGGF